MSAVVPAISSRFEHGLTRAFYEWWLLIALAVAWIAASALNLIPNSVFPDAQTLARTTVELVTGKVSVLGKLTDHVWISFVRFAAGYSLAAFIGILIGLLMATSSLVAALILPILRLLYPIPGLAWTPLVIMWAGIGENAVIVLIFLSAVWPVVYGAYDGFRNIPRNYMLVCRQFGATWSVRVRRVLLPAALPMLFSGLRLGHGMGWRAIVGAEMIAAVTGVGYMLNMGGELRRPDVVVVGMIVIAIMSALLDRFVFGTLEDRLISRWKR
jgi:ABC-type nitrate/sulfonate/bicarbonate transport system permease component